MLTPRHPSDIQDSRLLEVLERYVPPIIARSIVERARREAISGPHVAWTDPNGLLDRISVGVRLFAAPEHQAAILREITDLAVNEEEEEEATSRQFGEDSAPASTLKPSSARARMDEPRPRSDEPRSRSDEPRSRSDEPRSRPDDAPRSRSEEPRSRPEDAPRSRPDDAPTRRDPLPIPPPPASQPGSGPLSRREQPPSKRDTDIAAFTTQRAPEPSPSNRGIFPSGAQRTPAPTTPRVTSSRSSTMSMPAIPPPPGAPRTTGQSGTLSRVNVGSAPGANTPPTGTLAAIPPASPDQREITIALLTEHDIPRARQVAREICESLGTRALTQQRLVTIVSELGRNMVLYAGGGRITLRPPITSARRVVVIAVDQGPGIANLSEIMAGKYKSRSGLGLGIVGTKRLADSFHIETGRHGTAISVEVIV